MLTIIEMNDFVMYSDSFSVSLSNYSCFQSPAIINWLYVWSLIMNVAAWTFLYSSATCYIQSSGCTDSAAILSSKWTPGRPYFVWWFACSTSLTFTFSWIFNQMQYGQQMIGQPRPILYMPTYPPVRYLFLLSVLSYGQNYSGIV